MSSIEDTYNNVTNTARPVLLSIVAILLAVIATWILNVFFSFFFHALPELESLEWGERAKEVEVYMKEKNPFYIYTVIFAHAVGVIVGVYFATRTNIFFDRKNKVERPQWIAPLIVLGFWIYYIFKRDMVDTPVNLESTSIDILTTAVLSSITYLYAGGRIKIKPREEIYKG
jgi:hypothetical protein